MHLHKQRPKWMCSASLSSHSDLFLGLSWFCPLCHGPLHIHWNTWRAIPSHLSLPGWHPSSLQTSAPASLPPGTVLDLQGCSWGLQASEDPVVYQFTSVSMMFSLLTSWPESRLQEAQCWCHSPLTASCTRPGTHFVEIVKGKWAPWQHTALALAARVVVGLGQNRWPTPDLFLAVG
jgi:hypothetical protein